MLEAGFVACHQVLRFLNEHGDIESSFPDAQKVEILSFRLALEIHEWR